MIKVLDKLKKVCYNSLINRETVVICLIDLCAYLTKWGDTYDYLMAAKKREEIFRKYKNE